MLNFAIGHPTRPFLRDGSHISIHFVFEGEIVGSISLPVFFLHNLLNDIMSNHI